MATSKQPPFRWNPGAARYVRANGQFVSWSDVRAALDRLIEAERRAAREWTLGLRDGRVSLSEWRRNMQLMMRDVHLLATAAARGGWAQVTPADLEYVNNQLVKELAFLERRARLVSTGRQPLDGNLTQYAQMYAEAGYESFYGTLDRVMAEAGFTEERNVRHASESCVGCIEESARGWVPLGALVPIGQRNCLRKCKCSKVYRRASRPRTVVPA